MDSAVTGLKFFLPCLRRKLRIATDTSPKSISTGQGFRHLWHTVQWSATSLNSVEVRDGHAAPCLLLVQEGFDQQRGGQYLVARRIQQIGARHMRVAYRLAFAATQTILDRVGNLAQLAFFQDQAFQFHQVEAGRVGAFQVAALEQLALVEAAFGIDLLLVGGEGAISASSRKSNLVMPMPCSPEITPPRSFARCMMRATAP